MADEIFTSSLQDAEMIGAEAFSTVRVAEIVNVLGQLVSVIVLSRLLAPADVGIFAMAGPIYSFVLLLQNLSQSPKTIQEAAVFHKDVNTLFWNNVVVGAFLAVVLICISPLTTRYYGDARVGALTAAMSALVFIASLGNQHRAILSRRRQFRKAALLNTSTTFVGLIVSVIFTTIVKNYWALYAGLVASTAISGIGIWTIVGWRPTRPHLALKLNAARRFRATITASIFYNFASRNLDNVLIGGLWGEVELGLYDRAFKLLLFPLQRVVFPLASVITPVLSTLNDRPTHYSKVFCGSLSRLTFFIWPAALWALVFAHSLVTLILGAKWADAGGLLQPLAVAGLFQVVNGAAEWLFISQGRSKDRVRWSLINAVTSVPAFVLGLPYGPFGVAVAYAVSEALRTPFLWLYVTRRGSVRLKNVLRAVGPQLLGLSLAAFTLASLNDDYSVSPNIALTFGLFLSYGAMAGCMSLFPTGRTTVTDIWMAGRQSLSRLIGMAFRL